MRDNLPIVGTVLIATDIVPFGVITPADDLANLGYKIQDQGVKKFFSYEFFSPSFSVPSLVQVQIVQFASLRKDGRIYLNEILDWGRARNLAVFSPEHLSGFLYVSPEPKHPVTQNILRLVALGEVEGGQALCVWGKDKFKGASTLLAAGNWGGIGSEAYTFGFIKNPERAGGVDEIPSLQGKAARVIS